MAELIWAIFALMPFVFLRSRWLFVTYVISFSAVLAVLAYDYWVPFRYVAPEFTGKISDVGGGFSRAGNNEAVAYWISYPTALAGEDYLIGFVMILPLLLACIYRAFFSAWTQTQECGGGNSAELRAPH